MRIVMLLPLALAAAAAGGCRTASDGTEQAGLGVPQRDLTLQQASAPQVEVASPVELERTPIQRPASHRPKRAQQPTAVAQPETRPTGDTPAAAATLPAPALAPAPTHSDPAVLAAGEAEPPDPHALPPGRSVTVIPASTGSSTDEGWTDQRPAGRERGVSVGAGPHGGGCKPRGGGRMPGRGRPGPVAFR
jgi:hypothetical protein